MHGGRGDRLRELREAAGLTQAELADLVYVSRTAYQRWESGEFLPRPRAQKMLAKRLGVSVADLGLDREGPPSA